MQDPVLVALITGIIVLYGLDLMVNLITMYWVEISVPDDEPEEDEDVDDTGGNCEE